MEKYGNRVRVHPASMQLEIYKSNSKYNIYIYIPSALGWCKNKGRLTLNQVLNLMTCGIKVVSTTLEKNQVFQICSFSRGCNGSSMVPAWKMSHIREETQVQWGDIQWIHLITFQDVWWLDLLHDRWIIATCLRWPRNKPDHDVNHDVNHLIFDMYL